MNGEVIKIAAKVMKVTEKEAQSHYKEIPEIDGWYFWNPARGGIAVMINSEGEKLAAVSAVNFEQHLQAFQSGKRN